MGYTVQDSNVQPSRAAHADKRSTMHGSRCGAMHTSRACPLIYRGSMRPRRVFFGFENHESHQRLGKSMFAVVLNWGEQFARGGLLVILMVEVDLIVAVVLVSGHRDDPRGRGRLGRLGDRSILGSPLAQ